MKIAKCRNEIQKLSPNIFDSYGFNEIGQLDEFVKTDNYGNKFGTLIGVVKDRNSFSISVRVFIYYKIIEEFFINITPSKQYTINKFLSSESIAFIDFSSERIEGILQNLISHDAVNFFEEFNSVESIFSNINSSDHRDWVTSDKTALFKMKLASASLSNNLIELDKIKKEAFDYCNKPWPSTTDKEFIKKLCTCM